MHGALGAARGAFERSVEVLPFAFAEGWGGAGEGVEGVGDEAEVGDGGGGEVRGYFGEHFWGEGGEGWGGHLRVR